MEKRIGYLAGSVRPDDSLAATLLLAYHLEHRRDLLSAFLDALEIPNDNGIIDEDHDMVAPTEEALGKAAGSLFGSFEQAHVELYLASLLVMDNVTWAGMAGVIRSRLGD